MLFYKTFNKGPDKDWVVFIHGFGGSSTLWHKQLKEFRKHFNLLLIDLRGHGNSKSIFSGKKVYTFNDVSEDVLQVMKHLNIKSAHFIGVSLGTIIIRTIAWICPDIVKSMVLGGAITRFLNRSKFLIRLGNISKHIIPYIWLYKLFAFIMMPRLNHATSRKLFGEEAKKMCQKEFIRWFNLTFEVEKIHRIIEGNRPKLPKLYISGSEDYMFLNLVKEDVEKDSFAEMVIIKDCGHVCNVDQYEEFNRVAIDFINKTIKQYEYSVV